MAPPVTDLPRAWMVTRCASGGCVNLHLERTVVQLTPAETVALARLLSAAVRQVRAPRGEARGGSGRASALIWRVRPQTAERRGLAAMTSSAHDADDARTRLHDRAPLGRLRLGRARGPSRRTRLGGVPVAVAGGGVPGHRRPLRRARYFPQPHRDGSARLWTGRVQVLRLSAARTDRRAAHRGLPAAGADRQSLARRPRLRRDVPARASGVPRLAATLPASAGRRRCCCNTAPAISTRSTRISTATTSSRCNSPCCSRAPGVDFDGGEFVLTEQRPRMQSRVHVVPLGQGDGVIFAVAHRPAPGVRGVYRVTMRHGVSRLRRGRRHTLGVIFHDAT